MKNKAIGIAVAIFLPLILSVSPVDAACATSTPAATSTPDTGGLGYSCSYHYLSNGTYDPSYKNGCFSSYTETYGEASNYVLPAAPQAPGHQDGVLPPWKMVAVTL